jgi:peptidoglycan hydrolase-like protein with peptidoglycan-binding domain
MKRGLVAVFLIALMIVPLAIFGCKAKVEKEAEAPKTEATVPTEEAVVTQAPVTEPAPSQVATQEGIPPTAAVPPAQEVSAKAAPEDKLGRNKDVQTALKAAGFYTGNVDGKLGPKTKRAIVEFQKAKGLKADGKVGPKTWTELEKYLKQ